MNFLELSKERYSVRKFSEKKVEREKLEKVLEAGRIAPTAVNNQPQKVYLIESDEAIEKLKSCTKCCFNAKTFLLVCYDKTKSWKRNYDNEDGGTIDASIVGAHMMLEAVEQGLGTTWVGSFDPAKISEEFELDDDIVPVALFPIGYPAEDAEPSERHYIRKEIDEIVVYK